MVSHNVQLLFEDAIFNWVISNIPTIGSCALLMWCTWWVRGVIIDVQNRFTSVENRLTNVEGDCKQLSVRIDNVEAKLSARIDDVEERLTAKIEQVETKLTGLINKVAHNLKNLTLELVKDGKVPLRVLISMSPLALREVGVRVLNESGAKKFVDDNLEEFIADIKSENYKTAFDVENYCKAIFFHYHANDEGLNPVKEYAFNTQKIKVSETRSIRLEWIDIAAAMSIYLRDKYFEVYPELWEQARRWREEFEGKESCYAVIDFSIKLPPGRFRIYPAHPSLSKLLYCIASARCSTLISSEPERSAIVLETLSIRS